ncbi:MAG TPA: zinc ABC transporter substrate-binding protein [Pirellulales bacterium]|nr:zinc ABC transporter substrate-binding protein [Pirellulales bacterium]
MSQKHFCWYQNYGLCLLLACVAGCGGAANGAAKSNTHIGGTADVATSSVKHQYAGDYPMSAAATTGMVADLVARVGGRHVVVTQLMGAGVDPHLYKASTGDMAKLNRAEAIFYSGLHLEGKMGDTLARLARKKPTVAVAESISQGRLVTVAADRFDPHVWFDVALWSEALTVVENTLAEFDHVHGEEYHAAAAKYRLELIELDEYCRRELATIPAERRVLVTAHDAFHYFGRAYDLEVKAIQGVSTQSEAGLKEINELVAFIARRGIKAVFVESSVSERNVLALVEGCRARGHQVVVGGELFSDAMGKPGTPEGTYVGMVRHNVDLIVKALK